MPTEDKKTHNMFLYTLIISCLISIVVSFYLFYFKKNYDFIVETKCDSTTQTCFYRDCSIAGNCPPNNLSYYNTYTMSAKDFDKCANEDCTDFCTNNTACVKTECTDSDIVDGTCVLPTPTTTPISDITPISNTAN
ncbi:MAG: hypothetical protein NTW62_03180 [Candidatus Nomurabacteria bacterium]|nr:hypothetical protein [Candidatus Nomurabacteria bacterium]